MKETLWNNKYKILIYALFWTLASTVGKVIYETGNLSNLWKQPGTFGLFAIRMLVAGVLLLALATLAQLFLTKYYLRRQAAKKTQESDPEKEKKKKRLYFVVLLLLYFGLSVICYLAYYPGIFSYDAPDQVHQIFGSWYSNYQPLVHTLFFEFCIKVEGLVGIHPLGLILYVMIQSLIVAAVEAYIAASLPGRPGIGLYYLLIPTFALFSIVFAKDVLFGSLLMLWTFLFWRWNGNRKAGWVVLILMGAVVGLLRNNMVYAFGVMLLVALVVRKKKHAILLTTVILLLELVLKVVYPLAGVMPTSEREKLSVPIVQMMSIYENADSGMEEADREAFRAYFMYEPSYNPRFADPMKNVFDNAYYLKHKTEFWQLYGKYFTKMPTTFLSKFLDLNINFWYPFESIMDPYGTKYYVETYTISLEEYPITNDHSESLLPELLPFYEGFFLGDGEFMNSGIMVSYFRLSFPFWIMVLCLFWTHLGEKRKLLIWSVYAGLMLTYFLGPVSNYRYLYPFYLAMPMLVVICILPEREKTKESSLNRSQIVEEAAVKEDSMDTKEIE